MKIRHLLTMLTCCLTMGCLSIPGADIEFLEKHVPVGANAASARTKVESRGFSEIDTSVGPALHFDAETKTFEEFPRSFQLKVRLNLGFVDVQGFPKGKLFCFSRGYTKVVAAGQRLICWTVDANDILTWRQAGWRGASW